VSSTEIAYGGQFQVQTPQAANITSVVLVRPGAQTHAFDMDQRLVGLSYTSAAGVLNVTAPSGGNLAPPGYYMLFILDSAGVPSLARFVRLSAAVPNQPPSATITSPSGNVAIAPGQTVAFSGTGSDADGTVSAYSWTFPGGNPASSSVASPGNVTYSAPGTYVASFTVTDDDGAVSPAVSRTITVGDFSLSATPASRTVFAGASTTYSATVTPGTGFGGTVTFSVTGLPTGTSASFSPASVNTSGSTTLSVSTSMSTPAGSYPLTIRGTSGSLVRTVNVTLVVNADFAISAAPSSITINKGGTATYTVTVTSSPGFSGTVTFSVSGVPQRANASFTPASVVSSGTSVLSVATLSNVQARTRTLTIRGTSGGRTKSANVTLIIQ
jgi:hypothetical protein